VVRKSRAGHKVEHTQWSENQRHTTNAGLYQLLSKCMKFYEEMASTGGGAQRVCDDFNAYLKLNKMKFSSSTHTINKIVRVVFAADRKRVSAYGIALRAVIDNGKTSEEVPAFIEASGGIEALRLKDSKGARKSITEKGEELWDTLRNADLASVADEKLTSAIDLASVNQPAVLLATHVGGGKFMVHGVLQGAAPVFAAFAAYKGSIPAVSEQGMGSAKSAIEARNEALSETV
jgi:hypothetical protein